MKLEAIEGPVLYRWPGGEVRLEPGKPVDLPDDRARRVLAKAGTAKVRAIAPAVAVTRGATIMITTADGPQLATIEDVSFEEPGTALTAGAWYLVTDPALLARWVHESKILDLAPACPICGRLDRWQRVGQGIVCSACVRRGRP